MSAAIILCITAWFSTAAITAGRGNVVRRSWSGHLGFILHSERRRDGLIRDGICLLQSLEQCLRGGIVHVDQIAIHGRRIR